MLNHADGYHSLRAFLSDIRGATASNKELLKLINRAKHQIDQLRQRYRDGIPEELAKGFSRRLKEREWTMLHKALAVTDLTFLPVEDVLALLRDQTKVEDLIAEREEILLGSSPQYASKYMEKAEALATYMTSKQPTSRMLLRNAHAIAHLYGEERLKEVPENVVKDIEALVSLYAFAKLEEPVRASVKALAETEQAGMESLVGFLRSTRAMEKQRRDRHGSVNKTARANGWQGYVPATLGRGASVVLAELSEEKDLLSRGYTKVGTYHGDAYDDGEPRAYYQSTVGGRSAFRQGVAQSVHESWQGVDARTGVTKGEYTSGLIGGEDAQDLADALTELGNIDNLSPGTYLLPIFDGAGNVVGFERSLDPEYLDDLPRDEHLGRMLGAWAGRILEENAADEINSELVQVMKEIWDEQGDTREDEFVNAADPKLDDPVVRDAWDNLGWRIKQEIGQVFGEPKFFPVRKDMLDDALGYRAAGITDAWTGTSRWSPETQKTLVKTAEWIFGTDKAYKRLKQGEQIVQDAVSMAKTTIIVRSVVVAVGNFLSNMLYLGQNGINVVDGAKAMRKKFIEVTEYVRNQERMQALEVKAAANAGRPRELARIQTRIAAIEEANKALSIWPLIEAGEFSTISESLTEADVAMRKGQWGDWMEEAVDRLPDRARSVAANLLITKDSEVFRVQGA